MQPKKVLALRKRTQIAMANRSMFVWVAGASVLVGFAVVASIFLTQKLLFNEKILSEKNTTIKVLRANNTNISSLEKAIKVLDTNTQLTSIKANPDDKAVQVVLDALPSVANSLAVGSSLQERILNIPNLEVDTLNPTPVEGIESLEGSSVIGEPSVDGSGQCEIQFRFTAMGEESTVRQMLANIERSIRTIDILSLKIEQQSSSSSDGASTVDKLAVTVQARVFYEPEIYFELTDKVIRP